MIVGMVRVFRPVAQRELLQLRHVHLVLDVLEVQVLLEADFVQLALVAFVYPILLVALRHNAGEAGGGGGDSGIRVHFVRSLEDFRLEQRLPVLILHLDRIAQREDRRDNARQDRRSHRGGFYCCCSEVPGGTFNILQGKQ